MRLIRILVGVVLAGVALGAQTKESNDLIRRKIEVEDGKKVTLVGCLARNPGGGYMLMSDAGVLQYDLVTNKELATQVGTTVEVRGKATDRGDAKLTIESGDGNGATIKTEYKGTLGLKYLGVDQIKSIRQTCQSTVSAN
jgi:hypothetical protein